MRDRLIELIRKIPYGVSVGAKFKQYFCELVADHLLANGVIVPPCKVGDKVFQIEKRCLECSHFTDGGYSNWCECTLDDSKAMFEADFDKDCIYEIVKTKFQYSMIDQVGKTVFLTREEAESKLKGGEEE